MKDNFTRDVCISTYILFPIILISNVDSFYKMTSDNPMIPYVIGTYIIALYMSFITLFFIYLLKALIEAIKI